MVSIGTIYKPSFICPQGPRVWASVYAVERASSGCRVSPQSARPRRRRACCQARSATGASGRRTCRRPSRPFTCSVGVAGAALPTCRAATLLCLAVWGVPADQEFVAFGPRDPLVVNLQRFSELPSLVSLGKSLEGVCHSPLPCCILHACLLRHGEARCSHASNSRPNIGT